jgi:hypothetical protein
VPAAAEPLPEGAEELGYPGAAAIRRRAWRELRILWAAVALGILVLAPFGEKIRGLMFGCPFRELTGLPCPTCGTTRAAMMLARFDFVGALLRFPLPTLAWTLLIGGGLLAGLSVLLKIEVPEPPRTLKNWQIWTIVGALAANWVYSLVTGV